MPKALHIFAKDVVSIIKKGGKKNSGRIPIQNTVKSSTEGLAQAKWIVRQKSKQAGAELCQAQGKLKICWPFTLID